MEEVDGVDGDDSDADKFLHDLEPDGEDDAPAQLPRIFVFWPYHRPVVVRGGRLELEFDNLFDASEFVFDVAFARSFEHTSSFSFTAHFHEPARGFGKEIDADADYEDENDLEREGGAPGHYFVGVEVGKILDPVCEGEATDVLPGKSVMITNKEDEIDYHEELNSQESPSGRMAADLRRPHRDHTINRPNTDPCHDSRTSHPGDIVRRSLENGAQ